MAWDLPRGVAAALLITAPFLPHPGPSWVLRGCPMCGLLGLAERPRALSTQRG